MSRKAGGIASSRRCCGRASGRAFRARSVEPPGPPNEYDRTRTAAGGGCRGPSDRAAIGRRVVTEFNYRLSGRDRAHIFVGIATRSRHDGKTLAATLNATGYETVDLTDNEMAKLHVRHMVGGHAPGVRHERL